MQKLFTAILGVGKLLKDQTLVTLIYVNNAYNEWVANFCKRQPTRFVGLACIPNHDPELAAKELERAAKLGLRGADFAVPTAVKPLYHRDWDVLGQPLLNALCLFLFIPSDGVRERLICLNVQRTTHASKEYVEH